MKKWRNKITGEINEFMVHKRIEDSEDGNPVYAPFDGNIDEWEDYKELKTAWFIDSQGDIQEWRDDECDDWTNEKEIGNYFKTKEEAEKVVEKLKAWKRLKDKGFRFTAWYGGSKNISYEITSLENGTYIPRQICDDLDLLFGGEK